MRDINCGTASNHSDVMHWFVKHNKTMDDFREDVARKLNMQTSKPEENLKEPFIIGNQDIADTVGDKDNDIVEGTIDTNVKNNQSWFNKILNFVKIIWGLIKKIFKL